MSGIEEWILSLFSQSVYEPYMVYFGVSVIMFASSFGFPIPEEVTLISVGFVAFMGSRPDLYPPPYPGAEPVNLIVLANVCFFSVIISDFIVYSIGRIYGKRILTNKWVVKLVSSETQERIQSLAHKYSFWISGIFRFTPGLRFPGHLSCGVMGIPVWKFLLVDGMAALLSVPTQVLLVAHFGEVIVEKIKLINRGVAYIVFGLLLYFITKKIMEHYKQKRTKV